jgi:hypothetical protein
MERAALLVRPVEYEMVPTDNLTRYWADRRYIERRLEGFAEVAVLRCVDHRGEKLTAVGNPDHLRDLLSRGEASDQGGMPLQEPHWPVVVRGWLQAS